MDRAPMSIWHKCDSLDPMNLVVDVVDFYYYFFGQRENMLLRQKQNEKGRERPIKYEFVWKL